MLAVAPALRGGLHHVPGAVEVGVDDGVPALDREVDRSLRGLSAGAVDEDIEAAVLFPDLVEQGGDRLGLADIHCKCGSFEAVSDEMRNQQIELGLVAPRQHHMRAEPREQPGDGATNATGSARDQRDLVLQRLRRVNRRTGCEIVVG
ncbi:hypothetical protein ES703_90351 [subsurface metagenome]